MNPTFAAMPVTARSATQFLPTLETVCRRMRVDRVASVRFGFEDEGPVLKSWRRAPGQPTKLTMYCNLPGDVEAFGPYADAIE